MPNLLRHEIPEPVSSLANEHFGPRSHWIIARASTETYAALHHVVKSGAHVRLLIVDATQGKDQSGLYAMSYGGVYVASVTLGNSQLLKALTEVGCFMCQYIF